MNAIRQVLSIALLLVFALLPGNAAADAPLIQLDVIPSLAYASFPQNYQVTGTISHLHNNLNSLKDLTMTVNGGVVYANEKPWTGNDIRTSAELSLPWTIPGPGTYTITVSARHGGFKGTASRTVTVTLIVPEVNEDGPAAPAIAAEYLRSLGYRPNSVEYKNIIASVTETMQPGTDFQGVPKSSTAEYEAVVKAYVYDLLY